MQDRAAILAIGSELLAGQIANTNAAWLSQHLGDQGIRVVRHLTVDDVQEDITAALDLLAQTAGTILVTGGLGPTSDDLTRQAVAAWAGTKLVYHPGSWLHVAKIFQGFQMSAPESNRQQCWFPESAQVLTNRAGTANAFALTCRGTAVIVLPGPPREVEAIWNDHVVALLTAGVPQELKPHLKMWRAIGKGESHVAEVVEPLVGGQGLDLAYRAHPPYVEVKLRFPAQLSAAGEAVAARLDAALAPWLYERDRENHAARLIAHLASHPMIDLYDGATQGHLTELLAPYVREQGASPRQMAFSVSWENHEDPCAYVSQICDLTEGSATALVVAGFDPEGGWAVGMRRHGVTQVKVMASPYRAAMLQARNLKAVAYLAAKEWREMMEESAL